MPTCPHCGHDNADDATFCANRSCGEVLRWSRSDEAPDELSRAERAAALAVDLPDERAAPAARDSSERTTGRRGRHAVLAFLSTEVVEVAPGEVATCDVRVRNDGTVVDQYAIQVHGDAAGWAACEPAAVNVYPDRDELVVIRFQPPRAPTPVAGPVPFRVTITSTQDATATAEQHGTVHVQAFREVRVTDLEPQTLEARRTATFSLAITNAGNTPEPLSIDGDDRDNLVRVAPAPPGATWGPGETGQVAVTARAHRLLWTGEPRRRPFTVEVRRTGEDGATPIAEIPGALRQRVVLWGWVPRLLILAVLLLVAAGVALFLLSRSGGPAEVPELVGRSVDEARDVLSDAGLELGQAANQVDPEREPGTILAQDPQAGQEVDPGSSVDVLVAQGDDVVEVPSVTGLALADAQATLSGEGLAAGEIIEEESGLEPGTVLAQEPGAGEGVREGSTVDLLVAVAAGQETEAPDQPAVPPPADGGEGEQGGEGPDLAVALDTCALVPGGAASGADALTIFLAVPNLVPSSPVDGGVEVRLDSEVGLSGSSVGAPTTEGTVRPAQVELGPDDYQGPVDLLVTVDPDDQVTEVDESNNQLVVRVGLPDSQPSQPIDPLPCEQVG